MATLIIGATGGIGSALSRAWPKEALWLSGRNSDTLSSLAQALQATPVLADLGYESHVRTLFEGISLPLDTIVYAAGSVLPEVVAITSPEGTRRTWNANYFGVLWTLKYGLPKLSQGGRFYVLGAQAQLVTARGFSQYAASKAAMARLLEVARLEHRQYVLTVVLPPAVQTGLWDGLGPVPPGALTPEHVAEVIVRDRFEQPGQFELSI
ncbi:SDR family NAD(P)-dependent oxidoreductase [Deinococcus peraridilitoris]|uniref:Short-chain alcohol dehydrogenase n=1 Tax=Deinococcus peraridilitoris (strain DSM 19664 / LMG 22246 / CIP 109416 / KR-200) TaxID=937777 RepID=L0A631_DEIPD|nr:SDR family NAD(P)-dependent oxidoreductase [Deinococcus peraridilitoris]AFZ68602.1 short-chain dehydrogenase of unknown substrate specificity [Deinococcus peraridilitoris DSM 19664]